MQNTPTPSPKRRVLLIGWDAADWIVLNQLMDAGRMPNLARFIESGTIGNLASLQPCLSPMLWTSAATGKSADQHGILGFVEPRADGLGIVPSQSTSRRCKALWNMLGESGLRSCVVAWPVSDPAEAIHGVYISERMAEGLADRPEDIGPVAAGCVHPPELAASVSALRLHPCELAPADLTGMIPDITAIDLDQDDRPAHLARLFARCVSVHAVATAAMEAEPWDFFAVYYDAIDRGGHDFMGYRAPRMDGMSEQDFRSYGQVLDGLYEFHDAMLGRLLDLAGEDTTVILMSDHGFQSGNLRPVKHGPAGQVEAEGADWHRMFGVFAIKGPGIKCDERVYGATLLDIAPTVLNLFGLPVGRDMAGRVLTGVFSETPAVQWIDTWESAGQADPPAPVDVEARTASIQQLVALGYLSADAVDGAAAAAHAEREARFNLGTVHLHHGRPAAALPLFERLSEESPAEPRYALSRLHALSRLGRHRDVLELVASLEADGICAAQLDLLAAAAWGAEGRGETAEQCLQRAAEREPGNPAVHQVAGDYHLARLNLQDAQTHYAQAVALNPENAQAYSGLAQIALHRKDFAQAAEHALASLQLMFWNPQAQFRLGQALHGLGEREPALRALNHAVAQAPRFGEAHFRLAALYEEEGDYANASIHWQRALGHAVPTTGSQ